MGACWLRPQPEANERGARRRRQDPKVKWNGGRGPALLRAQEDGVHQGGVGNRLSRLGAGPRPRQFLGSGATVTRISSPFWPGKPVNSASMRFGTR